MKTSFISNISVQSSMRSTIAQVQAELIRSQKEVVTGKLANIGTELGGITARNLNLHRDLDGMENLLNTNSIVDQRLAASETAMKSMAQSAQMGLQALIALSGATDKGQLAVAEQTLRNALDAFTDAANSSMNGEYLFAGINTDVKPVADYQDSTGSAAKTSFDTAFSTYFGFPKNDPLAEGITKVQMDDFITNVVEPMYSGPQWNADWSTASDTRMTSRISRNEVVDSSTTINEPGFRNMALASVIGIELINSPINKQVRQLVVEKTIDYMGQSISGIDYQRGQVGLSQQRVKNANDSISAQLVIIKTNINDMEGVDVYEASTRMTSLMNQMEISYSLTARISQLSLVNTIK